MLTARIWTEYGQGTVDPSWDPLSPEHGLPRNLVFVIAVIFLIVVSGRSPSHCIPLTDLDCSTGDGKRQERKFLKGRREKAMGGEHKAVSRLHGIHEKYRWIHAKFAVLKSCTKPGANLTFPCGKYIVNLVRKKKINRPGSLTDQAESWLHRQDPYT